MPNVLTKIYVADVPILDTKYPISLWPGLSVTKNRAPWRPEMMHYWAVIKHPDGLANIKILIRKTLRLNA